MRGFTAIISSYVVFVLENCVCSNITPREISVDPDPVCSVSQKFDSMCSICILHLLEQVGFTELKE